MQKQTQKKICRSKPDKKPLVWYRLHDFTFVHEQYAFDEMSLQRAFLLYSEDRKKCKHNACRLSEFQDGECYLHYKITNGEIDDQRHKS